MKTVEQLRGGMSGKEEHDSNFALFGRNTKVKVELSTGDEPGFLEGDFHVFELSPGFGAELGDDVLGTDLEKEAKLIFEVSNFKP